LVHEFESSFATTTVLPRPIVAITSPCGLFDPQTRLWAIYWADSNAVRLDVIVKFHWDKRNPEAHSGVRPSPPMKAKRGEWNWYAYFARL
jgi:hypothetical protein